MKLYYHHVGTAGAARDFPRTVYNRRDVRDAVGSIPAGTPGRERLERELQAAFPSGDFNCWGVPSGAKPIKKLAPGDVILLVDSIHAGDSGIPALCEVKVFLPEELPHLPTHLWGEPKFPYIFFFDTVRINLDWPTFAAQMGFEPNYNPQGKFYSVADARLADKGGGSGYVRRLCEGTAGE